MNRSPFEDHREVNSRLAVATRIFRQPLKPAAGREREGHLFDNAAAKATRWSSTPLGSMSVAFSEADSGRIIFGIEIFDGENPVTVGHELRAVLNHITQSARTGSQ